MAAAEKQAVTGAGPFNGLLTWIDQRFPLMEAWRKHLTEYYAPKNFNFWYYFGSLALFVLVIQIVTGIFLTMNYKPDAAQAFASVEYIMREVPWGWWIRYMHSTGASFFFICVYLHMFRAMLYGSYRRRSEEHTSELQSRSDIVCRLLLEKKKNMQINPNTTLITIV